MSVAPSDSHAPTTAIDALAEWALVKDSMSVEAIEQFLAKHGGAPIYGALARERLTQLQGGGELSGVEEPQATGAGKAAGQTTSAPVEEIELVLSPDGNATVRSISATDCDRLAAPPGAASTIALGLTGVAAAAIDGPNAVAACLRALSTDKTSARLKMTLARALEASGRNKEATNWYHEAALGGDPVARAEVRGSDASGEFDILDIGALPGSEARAGLTNAVPVTQCDCLGTSEGCDDHRPGP